MLALSVSLALPLQARPAGSADGTLTVGDKTTKFAFAYAKAEKGFFDEKKEDIVVILSDVPLSPDALADQFERMKMAREGKLHAVELRIDSDKQVTSGTLLHEAFAKFQGSVSATGMHRFDATAFDGKTAAGKLATSRPSDFRDIPFSYSATFEAPIARKAAPTFVGAAARDSSQAKAVLAFYKAVQTGKKAAIVKTITAEDARKLDGPEAKEMLELLKAVSPDPARAEIEAVEVAGDKAKVTVVERSKDGKTTSSVDVVLAGGQWKVAL